MFDKLQFVDSRDQRQTEVCRTEVTDDERTRNEAMVSNQRAWLRG